MSREVAILGCGPAGLLAAHAFIRAGWEVNIYSRKVKSQITGAMFLHSSIPDITGNAKVMEFVKQGDRDGYAHNVYGDIDANVSWDKFEEGPYPAWFLDEAYDRLWHRYEDLIVPTDIDPLFLDILIHPRIGIRKPPTLVVSTIQRNSLCIGDHSFPSQKIWLQPTAPRWIPDNTIVYNGGDKDIWYRASVINGIRSTESRFSMFGAKPGYKPIKTNCTCHPQVAFLGRFGEWNKQVLLHHVYEKSVRLAKGEVAAYAV